MLLRVASSPLLLGYFLIQNNLFLFGCKTKGRVGYYFTGAKEKDLFFYRFSLIVFQWYR
jgi:hypothetical protein